MIKQKMGLVTNSLLLIWFMCIPVFWHLDLSKGALGLYDVFAMAPYAIFHLVIFYLLALLSIYFNKFSLYHLLLLSLYFPFIQLANYPYLIIRDVYLHAAPTRTILENGILVYPKTQYPTSWPASFDLFAILSIVTGCDLVTANHILYLALIVGFAFTLYSLARTFEHKGYRLAWISAIAFLCLFFNHFFDNFHHYSRTALAFTLLLFFLYSFLRLRDRRGLILQMSIIMAVTVTHPFQSLALMSFMIAFFVLTRERARPMILTLFSVATFLAWFLFQASFMFSEAIDQLKNLLSPEFIAPITRTIVESRQLPWWGGFLRDYYKFSVIILFAASFLVAIPVLYGAKRRNIVIVSLLSLLFSSAVMLIGLLLLPDWQINRFTSFAAFPAAFSSIILLEEEIRRGRLKMLARSVTSATKKTILPLLLVFVISLSAVVMVLRFERNYYFGEVTHPSELSALSFFSTYDHSSTVAIVSWRTAVYYSYFNYNSSHNVLRLWYLALFDLEGNSSKLMDAEITLINQSESVIRGLRDSHTLGLQGSAETVLSFIDDEAILPYFNLVYSSEYYSLYDRALPPG